MHARSVWGLLALLGVVGVVALPGVVAVTPAVPSLHIQLSRAELSPHVYGQTTTQFLSLNWAGYATYTATAGTVTKVSGKWIEPAVTCPATGSSYAVFWVGIDGFNSYSVEQTGTFAICDQGVASYVPWWELYPTNDIQVINTFTVSAGDAMQGIVTYHPSTQLFTMTLKDLTNGGYFSVTATQIAPYNVYPFMQENSAECIIERPAFINGEGQISFAHLANFGVADFTACKATESGVSAPIGDFVPGAIIYMVTLPFNPSNVHYLASPGGPTNLNTWGFDTTWQGYGTPEA